MIDNYDAIKESSVVETFDKLLLILAREGINLGIHLVISASRTSIIRYNLAANLKTQLSFFVLDKSDIVSAVGRTQLEVEEIPGRAIIKLDEPTIFQVALPIQGIQQADRVKNMRAFATKMREQFKDQLLEEVAVVPEVLTNKHLLNHSQVKNLLEIDMIASIGLYLDTVKSVTVDFNEEPLLIVGQPQRIKPVVDAVVSTSVNANILILDSAQKVLRSYADQYRYESEVSSYVNLLKVTIDEIRSRKEHFNNTNASDPTWKQEIVVIADMAAFMKEFTSESQQMIIDIGQAARQLRVALIFIVRPEEYSKLSGDLNTYINSIKRIVLLGKVKDVPRITVSASTLREPEVANDEANYIEHGQFSKFKLVTTQE